MDVTLQWDATEDPSVVGCNIYYKVGGIGEPYDGTGATEGDSPVSITLAQDENSDPLVMEFTLRNLSKFQNRFIVTNLITLMRLRLSLINLAISERSE
jgi:hypothetical protein